MLTHLSIRNYALIRSLDIDFSSGLHIITGETGAGKSILLGALGLILGERADSKSVQGEDKCVVEAEFDILSYGLEEYFSENDLDYAPQTVLRREQNSQGKSRAFINDTPVSLNVLKDLGERLVDIHSQHETLSLKDKQYQLDLLDTFAGNNDLLREYKHGYKKYKQLQNNLSELVSREASMLAEYDFQQFQLNELLDAKLKEGEVQELEQELQTLENAGEIIQLANAAAGLLKLDENALLDQLAQINQKMKQLSGVDARFGALATRIESTHIELSDISAELESIAENTSGDESRLTAVNDRLSLLYNLLKKHRAADISDLIETLNKLTEATEKVEHFGEEVEKLKEEVNAARSHLIKAADALSGKRQKAVPVLEQELHNLLAEVGMPNARVRINLVPYSDKPGETGNEGAELLFSSNKGSEPLPLNKIASGGELSRFMLCVKSLLAGNKSLPTLIFDEIDTGISGEVAQKVGRLMKKLGNSHQVISVTHLPQIAGVGEHHYYVYKEVVKGHTHTHMKLLGRDERITEIARMLSGENPSTSAMANARELMGLVDS